MPFFGKTSKKKSVACTKGEKKKYTKGEDKDEIYKRSKICVRIIAHVYLLHWFRLVDHDDAGD